MLFKWSYANHITHIPYLATRILINTNKSRLAEVLPHKGFRNHNLLINKSTPLYVGLAEKVKKRKKCGLGKYGLKKHR
jgi:hypothetical protein